MNILIDGTPADITLETEKTAGEVIAALEKWLFGSGLALSGISVNGEKANGSEAVERLFNIETSKIEELEVITSPVAMLALEAIIETKIMLEQKSADWESSAAASFLREKDAALFSKIEEAIAENKAFDFTSVIEERERELRNSAAEFLSLKDNIQTTVLALENFALDLQMGKDKQANETVKNFAFLASKIFRLLPLLRCAGLNMEKLELDENFFIEFNSALNEFFSAYEDADTVLAGDLAEYEVSPRLKDFYNALKKQVSLLVEV
ncbi:MAG: hypothetical protein LBG79_06880 [Spirochaetaceae bacterium]|jgi:hypothetical protein|nr:hypothetical protein [Spirochaetaceae bacterium]GMO20734.1 MAG: hypothetical protein Pg6A_07590 [Termitinemataceae bacterium]